MIPPILKTDGAFWQHLSETAPARAGDLAYLRFCTPRLSERRTTNHEALVSRARYHLRHAEHRMVDTVEGPVRVYIFEPTTSPEDRDYDDPKTVVLAHGWTSEASFMSAIAEALRRGGFRVVLFDCPAHGLSPGTRTSLIACARALIDVIEACGPVHYCLAHSLGCLAAQLVARGGKPFRKKFRLDGYVFISPPNDFRVITDEFCDILKLSPTAKRHYERHLERVTHRPLSTLNTASFLNRIKRPALLIHSQDDHEVRVSNSLQVAAACDYATLKVFDGLGHRRILYASSVMRESVRFIKMLDAQQAKARETKLVPIHHEPHQAYSSPA